MKFCVKDVFDKRNLCKYFVVDCAKYVRFVIYFCRSPGTSKNIYTFVYAYISSTVSNGN